MTTFYMEKLQIMHATIVYSYTLYAMRKGNYSGIRSAWCDWKRCTLICSDLVRQVKERKTLVALISSGLLSRVPCPWCW